MILKEHKARVPLVICYKNEAIRKKLNYLCNTIPSRKLEDCTIFSNGRLLI